VRWESENRATLSQWPEIREAADFTRAHAKEWIHSAIALRDAYAAAATAENRAALDQAISVLQAALTQASVLMARPRAAIHPSSFTLQPSVKLPPAAPATPEVTHNLTLLVPKTGNRTVTLQKDATGAVTGAELSGEENPTTVQLSITLPKTGKKFVQFDKDASGRPISASVTEETP
jgi:hypothetical protein